MKDWLPGQERETYFGLDRGKSQLPNGKWLVADINVSDVFTIPFSRRILSWPWMPWVKYEYIPRAYLVDDTILVSYETYKRIKGGILNIDHVKLSIQLDSKHNSNEEK